VSYLDMPRIVLSEALQADASDVPHLREQDISEEASAVNGVANHADATARLPARI
jgi:hypothetical protein